MKKEKHLSFEMVPEEHMHLKILCTRIGQSIKDFVNNAVRESMKKHEEQTLMGIDAGLKDIREGRIHHVNASEFEKYA